MQSVVTDFKSHPFAGRKILRRMPHWVLALRVQIPGLLTNAVHIRAHQTELAASL